MAREWALSEDNYKRLQYYIGRANEALNDLGPLDDRIVSEIHSQMKEILEQARFRDPNLKKEA